MLLSSAVACAPMCSARVLSLSSLSGFLLSPFLQVYHSPMAFHVLCCRLSRGLPSPAPALYSKSTPVVPRLKLPNQISSEESTPQLSVCLSSGSSLSVCVHMRVDGWCACTCGRVPGVGRNEDLYCAGVSASALSAPHRPSPLDFAEKHRSVYVLSILLPTQASLAKLKHRLCDACKQAPATTYCVGK